MRQITERDGERWVHRAVTLKAEKQLGSKNYPK